MPSHDTIKEDFNLSLTSSALPPLPSTANGPIPEPESGMLHLRRL